MAALVPALHVALAADSVEDVAKTLKGKTVLLRQMYAGGNLSFDSQGNATGKTTTDPFYLSAIKIEKVHLSNSQVELKGHWQMMLCRLKAEPQSSSDIQFLKQDSATIIIQHDQSHPEAFNTALQKIFAPGIDEILADKTSEQKRALLESVASLLPSSDTLQPGVHKVSSAGNRVEGVVAPKLLHAVDPEFPDKARNNKTNGACTITFIVSATGRPTSIHIKRSAGMEDMDINAIKAVSQYTFEPATFQGKPVPVQINVEVTYHIY